MSWKTKQRQYLQLWWLVGGKGQGSREAARKMVFFFLIKSHLCECLNHNRNPFMSYGLFLVLENSIGIITAFRPSCWVLHPERCFRSSDGVYIIKLPWLCPLFCSTVETMLSRQATRNPIPADLNTQGLEIVIGREREVDFLPRGLPLPLLFFSFSLFSPPASPPHLPC